MASNAFKKDDSIKTTADLIYERNTHRRQASELREERDKWSHHYDVARANMVKWIKSALLESKDKEPIKQMMWKYYEEYPSELRIYTEKSTGEKTHKGVSTVRRTGGVVVEIEAHLTPDGDYYKPWCKDDKPSYFIQPLKVSPDNFTISDKGELVPIKKY